MSIRLKNISSVSGGSGSSTGRFARSKTRSIKVHSSGFGGKHLEYTNNPVKQNSFHSNGLC
ncbi:MAG: hypothetical protein ACE5SW_12320 [Nitrososphaeraceae archaeon]